MPTVDVPDVPRTPTVSLPADRSAVIVVDMQNDFVQESGTLHVPDAAATVPRIRELAARARKAGAKVVFTQDWHPEGDPEFEVWPPHARMNSWGARIVEGLEQGDADRVIKKPRYDGFYGTQLDHLLRLWNVRHVIVVGTVANICVMHTAASAALRWYDVTIAEDCVSALTPFDMASTLRQLTFLYLGRIVPSDGVTFEPASTVGTDAGTEATTSGA